MFNRQSIKVLVGVLIPIVAADGCATTSNPVPEASGVTARTMAVNGQIVETNDLATGQQIRVHGTPMMAMTALAQIYADLKIPIGTMITTTGQIGNMDLRVPSHRLAGKALSDFVNCGQEQMSGPRADLGDVTISVLSRALAEGDSATVVTTDVGGSARPIGDSSNSVPCQTTGALEHQINVQLAMVMATTK